jgi:hypothetical protein
LLGVGFCVPASSAAPAKLSVAAKKGTSLAVEKGPRVWLRSELWQYAEGAEFDIDSRCGLG